MRGLLAEHSLLFFFLLITAPVYVNDPQYKAVNGFVARIPQDILAQASFNCKAYTRALMHFEQFISVTKQDLHEHLDFLQVCQQWGC